MRTLLWLTVAVLVLVVAGVLTFQHSPGELTAHLYTQALQRDARDVVDAGRRVLNSAQQILDRSAANPHGSHTVPTKS